MEPKQEVPVQDNLAEGVAGVIEAVIGVGASVAKATARATSRGAVEPRPPETGAVPFSVLVHYSLETVGNLLSILTAGAALGKNASPVQGAEKANRSGIPRVRPGAQLRVPLMVENLSDRPMVGLSPLLRRVLVGGVESPDALPANAIDFAPANFTVAPRDFEKLTLSVAVPAQAVAGRYDLILALGPTQPDLPFSFEVFQENAV